MPFQTWLPPTVCFRGAETAAVLSVAIRLPIADQLVVDGVIVPHVKVVVSDPRVADLPQPDGVIKTLVFENC